MFLAWNASDETSIRREAVRALTDNVEFVDPDYNILGIEAFVAMVKEFRRNHRNARPALVGPIDSHHNLARYLWAVDLGDGNRLTGADVVAYDPSTCRIQRIESFVDAADSN
jgi:hypothetical protein